MNSKLERSLRLIKALEALVEEQEINLLAGPEYHTGLQVRTEPLVRELSRLAEDETLRSMLRPRVEKILVRRAGIESYLRARVSEMKSRVAKISESGKALKRLVPAYSPAAPSVARFTVTV